MPPRGPRGSQVRQTRTPQAETVMARGCPSRRHCCEQRASPCGVRSGATPRDDANRRASSVAAGSPDPRLQRASDSSSRSRISSRGAPARAKRVERAKRSVEGIEDVAHLIHCIARHACSSLTDTASVGGGIRQSTGMLRLKKNAKKYTNVPSATGHRDQGRAVGGASRARVPTRSLAAGERLSSGQRTPQAAWTCAWCSTPPGP
jgi:hypothetical protein